MSPMTRGALAGSAVLALTGAGLADNTTQDYETRIAELEAQVAQLSGDHWLTEQRSEEIRGLVQEVLADADTRASLLQSGMTAGYDDGFMIGSTDGNFSLRLNGQLQTRLVYNNQDEASGDSNRWGFENTRTKLIFSGNVGGPEFSYYIEGDFGGFDGRSDGRFNLDDAYVSYNLGNGWTLTAGQFKVPVNREWAVHSSKQLAVERSNVAYTFSGLRTQGLWGRYATDAWRVDVSINDGAGSQNGVWETEDVEWAFTARADFLLSGNWDQFEDFTSPQGSENGLMVGVGFHYQKEEYGTTNPNDDETEFWLLSGDVSWEGDGFNVFANISYADNSNNQSADTNPFGIVAQGGYYFTEKTEGFVRYEWADYDTSALEDLSIITFGVNHYYNANVKATADVGFGIDAVNAAQTITGFRNDAGDEDGQFVLRGQLQLTF